MVNIVNKTIIKPPSGGLIIKKIKKGILGPTYDLSLVFANNSLLHKLNLKYRHKDNTTNVLSFSLTKDTGEIFMNLSKIKKEAKDYKISHKSFFTYLFIHSLLHLKGFDHSSKMSLKEKYWLKKFKIPITENLQQFL